MNWIVCLTLNNLELTKRAVASFRAQDIQGGVRVLVLDNGSQDNTSAWLNTQKDLVVVYNRPALSVAASWNKALKWLLEPRWVSGSVVPEWPVVLEPRAEWALVCNNDVVLRPDTYRWLVEDGGLFVTAVGTRDERKIGLNCSPFILYPPDPNKKRPHPDFSCYLIRNEAWKRVGEFDEGFKVAFFEDNCYHLRMHRAGITAQCLELPFLHLGSMTIKTASDPERKRIQEAAERNKEYFFKKYGVYAGSPEYYALFGHSAPVDQNE